MRGFQNPWTSFSAIDRKDMKVFDLKLLGKWLRNSARGIGVWAGLSETRPVLVTGRSKRPFPNAWLNS
jgi:hypothetical protein